MSHFPVRRDGPIPARPLRERPLAPRMVAPRAIAPPSEVPRPAGGTREVPVCGLAAVRALFAARPAAIKRLFFNLQTGRRVGEMSARLAAERRIYRQVEPEELEKIAGTIHHGGIVAIIDQAPLAAPSADDLARWAAAGRAIVILDRVANAHNLGAIVRTLAFFGLEQLVVAADERSARPSEATYRIAEGGMEHVNITLAPDLEQLCGKLRAAGFAIVGTDVRGPILRSLQRREFLPKPGARGARGAGPETKRAPGEWPPVALLLGNEETGLAPAVAQACDRVVRIPGSGQIESLNVSAAAAVLIAALTLGERDRG